MCKTAICRDKDFKSSKSSVELADIFNLYSQSYCEQYKLSAVQYKAINAIRNCRTAALGGHIQRCECCDAEIISYNSCRNRNCPKCGNLKKEQWILDRSSELLPVPYFHTVFTIPHELNGLFLLNQKLLYSLLFKAASETLTRLALDPKYLGAQVGVTMVLHTWGQTLSFHPHVHCIVPGGGLSPSGCSFVRSRKKFFIPVKVLSKLFRGKFLALLKRAFYEEKLDSAKLGSFQTLLDSLYAKDWVVYCKKPFRSPFYVVQYLSRYTHKTAIYSNRLVAMDEDSVTFRYRDYRDNKVELLKLDAMEFIRRFMMHFSALRLSKN